MFETAAVDSVANRYVDKDVGGGTPGTRLEEADRNIIQDELVEPVESSGQALDPTGAIRDQLARATFIYGAAAQSVLDTGGAGAYVVDHVSAAFVVPTAFAQLDGVIAVFIAAVVNPGAATLDYMGLGAKPITDSAGAALTGGEMSGYVMLQYNITSDRWEVVFAKVDQSGVPVGAEMLWPGDTAPAGWFEEDGTSKLVASYPVLFAEIGYKYGGAGASFNIPDPRGRSVRIWDHGAGVDPDAATRTDRGDGVVGDNIGTNQDGAAQGHIHYDGSAHNASTSFVYGSTTTDVPGLAASFVTSSGGVGTYQGLTSDPKTDGVNGVPLVSSENRMTNTNRMMIIKHSPA